MRHLATVVAAIVIGPIVWVLLAFGQDGSAELFGHVQTAEAHPPAGDFLGPFLFIVAAGVMLGLLGTLRVSPLGAVVVGLGYLGASAAALVAPARVVDLLDRTVTVAGHHGNLATPVRTGATALLGSLLLLGIVSVGRWRRWPRPVETPADATLPDLFLPDAAQPDWPTTGPQRGTTSPRYD